MPPFSRRWCVMLAAAACLACGLALSAQSPGSAERPPWPTVDFTVVSADGTPVGDLAITELEIRVNGRLRTVRSLRRVSAAPPLPPPDAPAPPPPPFGTNDDAITGRQFALVVDEESFAAGRQPVIANAVEGLLSSFTAADQATVVALPYGGVKIPFTSDKNRIRAAAGSLTTQGVRTDSGSDLACRTRRFLEALDGYLHFQAGRSTPLTVIVFTAGLAAPRRDAPMTEGPGMCELLIDHYDRIKLTAGESRARVYLAVPDDVGMGGERWRDNIGGSAYRGSDNPLEGIEHLAGSTAGVRVPLDAAGTRALARVARETAIYYEAGLEPEREDAGGRSRPLDVRVLRRGVLVRARPAMTFGSRPSPGPAAAPATLPQVLLSREQHQAVRLRTDGFTLRQADGRLRIGVVAEVAEPGVALRSIGAVLVRGDGQVAGPWYAADPAERPILGAISAPAGTYRLRIAAVDGEGRFGTAETTVQAGLAQVGPLALGSMMLGVSRDGGVVPTLQFGREPVAIASFDIYGGDEGTRLETALEVARAVDGPALATLPLRLARATATRVVATAAIPLGALAPGDYVVRGIVRLDDGSSARIIRTLRKVPN